MGMGRCGQALTCALGPTTHRFASPQQLVPVISTNWDQTPWCPDRRQHTAASANQPPQPAHALEALREQPGNPQPLLLETETDSHPLPPKFYFLLPSLSPAKDEPEDVSSCPTVSPEPAIRSLPFAGLAHACSDEAEQPRAREDFNFQASDEKEPFKTVKRFSPLHSSLHRSVLCSLNRRHVLKLLLSFIKLASDLQMQLPLIESCNIYLPSCDI